MSTIKVTNIQHASTGDGGIQLDSAGHVTVDGQQMPTAGPLSNRNLVINGAMEVAQRGTSQASVSDGSNEDYQTLDRFAFKFANSAGGVCTISRDTEVPSNQGFSNSYKVDVTTADTSVDQNHMIYIRQGIEARNIRNSGWNYTSTSSYVTLSFWVKSSKPGTYVFAVRANDAGAIYYPFEYTLTANTWTKVTHSIPGDSSLVFANDNGLGLDMRWYLAVGTSRDDATANQWNEDNVSKAATSNQVNFFDSVDNDFYLTGVQLEVGEKATPFEHRLYHDELARCRRYYFQSKQLNATYPGCYYAYGISSDRIGAAVRLPVEMRTDPSFVLIRPVDGAQDGAHRYHSVKDSSTTTDVSFTSVGFADRGRLGFPYLITNSNAVVRGVGYLFHIEAHAEL